MGPPSGAQGPAWIQDIADARLPPKPLEGDEGGEESGEEGGPLAQGFELEETEAGGDDDLLAMMLCDEDSLKDPYAESCEEEEDEDEAFDGMWLATKRRDNRPRKTKRRANVLDWTPVGPTYGDVEDKDKKLKQLADIECNGGMWGNGKDGKGWKYRTCKHTKRRQAVRVRNCCFATESNCPARVRELQFLDGEREWVIEKYGAAHTDHTQSNRSRGVSLNTKLTLSSPSKQALSNKDAFNVVRRAEGPQTEKDLTAIAQVRKRIRKKEQNAVVPAEAAGTFGGVTLFVEAHSKAALKAKGALKLHTTFVCGDPIVDSATQTITIAYSTPNLLMNAYRQQQYGLPAILQVDTTHRLVLEGHNNMLFGTVDAAQHFHIIGYGLCQSEDQASHTHVMKCLAQEAELLIAECQLEQKGI